MAQITEIFTAYGYPSKVYNADIVNLSKALTLYAPVIVHYDKPDLHFAFVLYADDSYFVVADPVAGVEVQSKETFQKHWSNIMLVIKTPPDELNIGLLKGTVKQAIEKFLLLEKCASRIR